MTKQGLARPLVYATVLAPGRAPSGHRRRICSEFSLTNTSDNYSVLENGTCGGIGGEHDNHPTTSGRYRLGRPKYPCGGCTTWLLGVDQKTISAPGGVSNIQQGAGAAQRTQYCILSPESR